MTYQEVYLLETLSVEAKGIYGALYSFVGAESTIYPSANYLCKILHMSKKRFRKHMDLLIRAGIVKKIKRMKEEFERLPVNVYTLAEHIQFDSGQIGYVQKVNTNNKALNNVNKNGKENIDYQKIVDFYNDICVSIVDRIFAEDIYNNLINAVRAAISNDTKEFPPVQDQIKELIERSSDDTEIMSDMEASDEIKQIEKENGRIDR